MGGIDLIPFGVVPGPGTVIGTVDFGSAIVTYVDIALSPCSAKTKLNLAAANTMSFIVGQLGNLSGPLGTAIALPFEGASYYYMVDTSGDC